VPVLATASAMASHGAFTPPGSAALDVVSHKLASTQGKSVEVG